MTWHNFLLASAVISALVININQADAHPNGVIHTREMYSVLPFRADENGDATTENKAVQKWLKFLTSSLIDGYKGTPLPEYGGLNFYDYLRQHFDFHCKHRILFHWGFNARPWNDEIAEKVKRASWGNDPDSVKMFKDVLIKEQARRNGMANAATEKVFGLASGGSEAKWANGILSIVYDVHLLGDYVLDDNRDFDGVTPPSLVAGDIVGALRRIDADTAKTLIKDITAASQSAANEHERAALIIKSLQKGFPTFLLSSNGGSLKRRFAKMGYTFKRLP